MADQNDNQPTEDNNVNHYTEEQQDQLGKDVEAVFANGQAKATKEGELANSTPTSSADSDDGTDETEREGQEEEDGGASSAPGQTVPTDEGDGGDDEDDSGEGTGTPDDNAGDAGDSSTSEAPTSFKIGDNEYTPEQATEMQQAYQWQQGLAPEHVTAINALLSGEYVLVLRDEVEKQAAAPKEDENQEDFIDPRAAAEIEKVNAKLAEIESFTQQQQQQALQQTQVQQQAAIDQGLASFRDKHELSDEEINELQSRLVQAQILPGVVASVGGDVARGLEQGLEQVYWSDETFRQRELDRRIAADAERSRQQKEQRRKASSLHGSGGSVSRVPAAPSTKEERDRAMVEEIAAHMNSGQSS